jgi:hypothetical protein
LLTSREWHLLRPEFDEVRRVVEPTLDEVAARHLREWFAVGEQGFGMNLLVWLLLSERLPLDARTHGLVSHILTEMGPLPGRILPYLSDPVGVIALLDRVDEPLRRRGLVPQRGGHTADVGRGEVAFPPGWTAERIARAAGLVLETSAALRLANDRAWRTAVVDDVAVGVLTTAPGQLRAVVPVAPPATRPKRRSYTDPDRPAAVELLAVVARNNCSRLREVLHPSDEEAEALHQLQLAAEYDELADAVIARADQDWPHLDPDARRRARALLRTFDLPVEGCAHLNDRDATLARWAV